jgi:DNA-directed RNA polymerase subunit K
MNEVLKKSKIVFTKYEIARIIGARALQLAMGAPLLLDMNKKDFERINYSPIEIAKMEFSEGILPITIKRPLPKKAIEKNKL